MAGKLPKKRPSPNHPQLTSSGRSGQVKPPFAQPDIVAALALGPDQAEGDSVCASETPDRRARLNSNNRDFEATMAASEAIMREDRDILRALAT